MRLPRTNTGLEGRRGYRKGAFLQKPLLQFTFPRSATRTLLCCCRFRRVFREKKARLARASSAAATRAEVFPKSFFILHLFLLLLLLHYLLQRAGGGGRGGVFHPIETFANLSLAALPCKKPPFLQNSYVCIRPGLHATYNVQEIKEHLEIVRSYSTYVCTHVFVLQTEAGRGATLDSAHKVKTTIRKTASIAMVILRGTCLALFTFTFPTCLLRYACI